MFCTLDHLAKGCRSRHRLGGHRVELSPRCIFREARRSGNVGALLLYQAQLVDWDRLMVRPRHSR
jgi:hypothetical protein